MMHPLHYYLHYLRHKEIDWLYASVFLRVLAASLISIFVPAYLLILGYTVLDVIFYYGVHYFFVLLLTPIAFMLCKKDALRVALAGTVFFIIFYASLPFLEKGLSLFVPAIISAFASATYYAGFHLEFAHVLHKQHEGREISFMNNLSTLALTLGPLIGAIAIINSSFALTLFVVSILMVLSLITLGFGGLVTHAKFDVLAAFRKNTLRTTIAYVAEGVENLLSVVFWPLFIYVVLTSVLSLGVITSLSAALLLLVIALVGRLADKDEEKTLRTGVFFHAGVWVSRLLFINPIGVFVNQLLGDVSSHVTKIPFHKILYERAKKTGSAEQFFFREICLNCGRLFTLTILFLVLLLFQNEALMFVAAFVIAALATLSLLLLLQKT